MTNPFLGAPIIDTKRRFSTPSISRKRPSITNAKSRKNNAQMSTPQRRFSSLAAKPVNSSFLNSKRLESKEKNLRRHSSVSSRKRDNGNSLNAAFLQKLMGKENRMENGVNLQRKETGVASSNKSSGSEDGSSSEDDDIFNVNYSLYKEQNHISEYLINTLKNENFDLYSQKCLDQLKKERKRHIKKTKTGQNEAMIRNQYIKKQLMNVQLLNQREEMEREEKNLQKGIYELGEKAAQNMDLGEMMPLDFAHSIRDHQNLVGEYMGATENKWKNRRALQATLTHSKQARRTFEKNFDSGEAWKEDSPPRSTESEGKRDIRKETAKLLQRTEMLLAELEA